MTWEGRCILGNYLDWSIFPSHANTHSHTHMCAHPHTRRHTHYVLQLSPKSQRAVVTQTRAGNITANSCGQTEMWTHFQSHSHIQWVYSHKHTGLTAYMHLETYTNAHTNSSVNTAICNLSCRLVIRRQAARPLSQGETISVQIKIKILV